MPTLSTLNVSKIEKNEEESMLSPFHREQERRAKQLRRSYERDQERKEAARRGPSQVVRAAWGYDHTGRPYFSTRLPWVRYDPTTGEGVLDVETAAANGVAVYYDEARKEVVVR